MSGPVDIGNFAFYENFDSFAFHSSHRARMKRFIGLLMTVAGAVATLWGGYHVFIGQSSAHLVVGQDLGVTALVGGLAGLAILSIGLVWIRD